MTPDWEIKARYLEMVQSIITRMSSNSFLLKGWAITMIAGIFALSPDNMICGVFASSLIFLFWILDSMYLQFERQFKVLYKSIVAGKKDNSLFEIIRPKPLWQQHTKYIQAFFSRSEFLFYIALLVCNIFLTIIKIKNLR